MLCARMKVLQKDALKLQFELKSMYTLVLDAADFLLQIHREF